MLCCCFHFLSTAAIILLKSPAFSKAVLSVWQQCYRGKNKLAGTFLQTVGRTSSSLLNIIEWKYLKLYVYIEYNPTIIYSFLNISLKGNISWKFFYNFSLKTNEYSGFPFEEFYVKNLGKIHLSEKHGAKIQYDFLCLKGGVVTATCRMPFVLLLVRMLLCPLTLLWLFSFSCVL